MGEGEVVEALRKISEGLKEVRVVKPRRIKVTVEPSALRKAIAALKERAGGVHLFSIVGADLRDRLELTYNLWLYGAKAHVMVKAVLPRDSAEVETIVDLIPGSILYEREAYEALGVRFKNHPNLSKLFLPEEWPEGLYPLRKDAKLEVLE
ncbi:MAG: NADH-quinone oxidoreductase subunit C [Candidatus Nezhaarchaeota archaeon]|nr:NADH-quinone oxidoreductase subunit C [Candidatus Nezhaarchaeota archaeon]